MAKEMQTSIIIGGKTSPTLNRAFQAAQRQAQNTSKSMDGIGNVVKKVGGIIATAFAVDKVIDFGKSSIEAYNESVEAATKLTTIMKQRMNATDAQIAQINAVTAAQQKLGVVEDDTQTAGAQQLATFLNSSDSLKTLIPAMNNLAVQQNGVNVTSENMVGIGNLMGKAMQGQVGALSRVGITFNKAQGEVLKYGTEQQKAAILAQVITDNVGNMNKVMANIPEGKVQQLKNTWGDMKENIGKAMMELATRFTPVMAKLIPKINEMALKIGPIFQKIGDGIQWVMDNSNRLINILKPIIGIILSITSAIIAYNAVLKIQFIISKIAKGYELLTKAIIMYQKGTKIAAIAQELFNGTMLANPIGLVIASIMALVAGFVYFWNTSEKFRNFWIGLWNGIVGAVSKAINWIKINWPLVIGFIMNPIAGILGALYKYNDGFRSWVNSLVNIIKIPINGLIGLINTKFIASLNKIKIPSWVPKIGGKGFNIPNIPQFGTGGTVTNPQLAIVGDKPETIVPHGNSSRNRALLQEAASGVGGSLGGVVNNFTFAPVINGSGNDIIKQLSIEEENFERKMDAYFSKKGRLAFNG